MIHSPGSLPQTAALVEMRPFSCFLGHSLYNFTNKEPIGGDVRPPSGCPVDCLVTVPGQPRMGQGLGERGLCPDVLCIIAHRIHLRILGRIKELNLFLILRWPGTDRKVPDLCGS